MQSYSSVNSVGHQHAYVKQGILKSLSIIHEKEGIKGLWRGVDAAMLRTGVGSAVQLSTYDQTKRYLLSTGIFDSNGGDGSFNVHFAASLFTSLIVCIAMNPFDVASTRMVSILNNQLIRVQSKHWFRWKNRRTVQEWTGLFSKNSQDRKHSRAVQGSISSLPENWVCIVWFLNYSH